MNSLPISAADYHRATSYHRHRMTPHTLDWAHQPRLFKHYPKLPRVPLDRSANLPPIDYFDLVYRRRTISSRYTKAPDLQTISAAFRLTLDVTARSMHTDPPFYFRSAASAGALYPFELYLAVHHLDGLDPGVYHYDLLDFSLTVLRPEAVPEVPPAQPGLAATVYISGIFFRSAWKYRGRAYRYVLLDTGHLLENLRLALTALDLGFSIHLNFDDDLAATLLGLEPQREVCLACVHLFGGKAKEKPHGNADNLRPLNSQILQASTVSDKTVAYPEILAAHRAGNTAGDSSVDGQPVLDVTVGQPTSWIDLVPPDHLRSADYTHVLWQRRSRRNFMPTPVSPDDFMTFMNLMAGQTGRATGMPPVCQSALRTGFIVGEGVSIAPGFYLLDAGAKRFGRLFGDRLITPMATACLDQMWLKHAALHLLFMTDLAALDPDWGARGYRYVMIEAGRLGQQAYLAATALGWGACGIGAIYDREAADLIDLTVGGALLYLVGVGPVKTR